MTVNAKKFIPCVIAVLGVVALTWVIHNRIVEKNVEADELKTWQASPEYAFRFCITTVAGSNGTVSAEQIAACNKAAGR